MKDTHLICCIYVPDILLRGQAKGSLTFQHWEEMISRGYSDLSGAKSSIIHPPVIIADQSLSVAFDVFS